MNDGPSGKETNGLRKICCFGATEIPCETSFDQKQSLTEASPELTHKSDDANADDMPENHAQDHQMLFNFLKNK